VKPTTAVLMKRKEWAIDGAKAWDEYLAAPALAAAKTARLKQARLERAVAETVAAEKAASEKVARERVRLKNAPKTKGVPKETTKTATLRKIKLVATKHSA
jgi:hypothetical protein